VGFWEFSAEKIREAGQVFPPPSYSPFGESFSPKNQNAFVPPNSFFRIPMIIAKRASTTPETQMFAIGPAA